jgi:hypothetical protein
MSYAAYNTGTNTADSVTTPNATFTNPCNVVVAVVAEGDNVAPVMSDTKSNTYVLINKIAAGADAWLFVFKCLNGTGGSSFRVTAAKNGSNASVAVTNIALNKTTTRANLVSSDFTANDEGAPFTTNDLRFHPRVGDALGVGIASFGFPDAVITPVLADGWIQLELSGDRQFSLVLAYKLFSHFRVENFALTPDTLGIEDSPYALVLLDFTEKNLYAGSGEQPMTAETGMSALAGGGRR